LSKISENKNKKPFLRKFKSSSQKGAIQDILCNKEKFLLQDKFHKKSNFISKNLQGELNDWYTSRQLFEQFEFHLAFKYLKRNQRTINKTNVLLVG